MTFYGIRGLALLGIIMMLASCATSPKTQILSEAGPFAGFPQGALAYLYVDTVKARPILDAISLERIQENKRAFAAALDKTTSAVAALYPKGAPRHFLVAARGRYPRFRASLSFAFSAAWKKRRSETGATYWHSPQQGISVLLRPEQAFISDGDPILVPGASLPQAPEAFASFCENAVLAGWLTEGAMPLNQFLSSLEIPLQIPAGQVLFRLQQSEAYYQGMIRIETPSVSQAKALVSLFSMARLFMANLDPQEGAGVFFTNPPVQDGPWVNLRTGPLDAQGVSLLFSMFSLYFN
ncbi:MAG: hypothetical protein LBD93_02760 [Treponema sp.]|jgi:hypothetical protein|nr:hypothetical protein [Treponema sp.]